ncbi:MAG: hypothetical protein A2Y54_10800 [Chloroflexi bacterium RBG_16_51_16]|nr:MAG: hypothetical protein A2Y54_10800 [Chloroflexi bacterium RBG_16_51_16]
MPVVENHQSDGAVIVNPKSLLSMVQLVISVAYRGQNQDFVKDVLQTDQLSPNYAPGRYILIPFERHCCD